MSHIITINDIPLLASSPIQWSLRAGVSPVIQEYEMSQENHEKLINSLQKNNVNLEIDGVIFNNLYYLGNAPGPNAFIKRIIIADRRWLWDRHAIYRRYNIRRHVGIKRLKAINVEELQETAPEIRYAEYSVKSVGFGAIRKWTAKEILEDIIKELISYEEKYNSNISGYGFRGTFGKEVPVENLMIDDSGKNALNKILSYIGGADIYIDKDGKIIIYDKSDIAEINAEIGIGNQMLGRKLVGFGNMDYIDKSWLRPKEVRIMFHREVELRFDATETKQTIAYDPKSKKRSMANVISLPDWALGTDVQGTWLKIDDALNQWNSQAELDDSLVKPGKEPPKPSVIAKFSMDYLRKAFVPFLDFWSPFLLNGTLVPDRDWASRVASLMLHWRRTFQISRYWLDRIAHLKAYRISTTDIATGQRAPAIAYANYSQLYTERSFYSDLSWASRMGNSESPSYISNYPVGLATDTTPIDPTNKPAPVKVSILDHDQGIISLDFLGDVFRLREVCIPGLIGDPKIGLTTKVTSDIRRANNFSISFDAIGSGQTIPEIIDGSHDKYPYHVTTIILTAIPASPNDNRQYHVLVKKPADIKGFENIQANGPPMEVIVGSAIETARIRWVDSKKEDVKKETEKAIEKLFGVGLNPISQPNEEIEISQNISDTLKLVINQGSGGSGYDNYASLDEIAKAVAYRIYAALSDRLAGSAATGFSPNITLRGYLDEISHEVNPDGVALTRISSPTDIPQLDLFGLLDDNTRNVIMRLSQVGK